MNRCVICDKECTGDCCGGACRAKLSRRTRTVAEAHAHGQSGGARTERTVECNTSTRQEITNAISHYPQDTWKDSPEFAELMRRLHARTVVELKAEGYWIPAWKYQQAA